MPSVEDDPKAMIRKVEREEIVVTPSTGFRPSLGCENPARLRPKKTQATAASFFAVFAVKTGFAEHPGICSLLKFAALLSCGQIDTGNTVHTQLFFNDLLNYIVLVGTHHVIWRKRLGSPRGPYASHLSTMGTFQPSISICLSLIELGPTPPNEP